MSKENEMEIMCFQSEEFHLDPLIVHVQNYPHSFQAKAINYCVIDTIDNTRVTVYAHLFKENMGIKEIIEKHQKDTFSLTLKGEFVLSNGSIIENKTFSSDCIYLICQTNKEKIAVKLDKISIVNLVEI